MSDATRALRLSLSPTLISSTATVSFSLTMGKHVEAQEGQQGVPRVEIAGAVADVLRGEQHLPDRNAVALEGRLVVPHERRLSDGGRGLLLGDRARAPREGESGHPGGDGPRGHEHDLTPLAHARDLRGQGVDAIGVDSGLRRGDQARADLDDQASDPAQGPSRIALGVSGGSAPRLPRSAPP